MTTPSLCEQNISLVNYIFPTNSEKRIFTCIKYNIFLSRYNLTLNSTLVNKFELTEVTRILHKYIYTVIVVVNSNISAVEFLVYRRGSYTGLGESNASRTEYYPRLIRPVLCVILTTKPIITTV